MPQALLREISPAPPAAGRMPSAGQLLAVCAGNTLEVYDFLTYAAFSIYIGAAFFPSHDPTASLLASLATFGAGFVTRPLGALVIGRLGDRVGRKPAMLVSFWLMGLAIAGMALTPPQSAIGVAAPVLVIALRLLQGFALGGEIGPSTSFLLEAAPPHRRGLFVSLQYAGQSVAVLAAGAVGMGLAAVLDEAAFRAVGWRIAMLLGALVVPIGLAVRRNLPETLEAAGGSPERGEPAAARGGAGLWKAGAVSVVLMSAGTTVGYVLNYMTTYAIGTLHMPAGLAFGAGVVGGLLGIVGAPLGAWLSDRFGRRPVMLGGWLFLLLAILPAFQLVARERAAWALFACVGVLSLAGTGAASAVLASVTEMLPRRARSGGLALIYALSMSIFGGSAQFNVAWLTAATGSPLAPAWYMIGGVVCGLAAMLAMRETAPARVAADAGAKR